MWYHSMDERTTAITTIESMSKLNPSQPPYYIHACRRKPKPLSDTKPCMEA